MDNNLKFIQLVGLNFFIITLFLFSSFFYFATKTVYAEAYECVISATNASGCDVYSDVRHVCRFPEELNEARTLEKKMGKYTYPKFCEAICAEQSGIPKKCRAGRVDETQSLPTEETLVVLNTDLDKEIEIEENTVFENAYEGAKLAMQRFWGWLKKVSSGESFEIEPTSTSVAGVRG